MPTTRRAALGGLAAAALAGGAQTQEMPVLRYIRHVDIIHHSHTDIGYTDLPSVTRDLQVRFLDAAIDCCLHNPRFRWTCEALVTVDDFWREAPVARKDALLRLVRSGQMDAMALPFNQAPFMNAAQWREAMQWIPAPLWRALNPRVGMQNDVNGFPRAGALQLLDRGIRHLMMGINVDMGGTPFPRPTAFWWRMPDARRLFVWLGDHYGTAYSFFESKRWQRGQAKGATTELRPPYEGDHLKTDEASLRASHAHFLGRLGQLETAGYALPRLILSYTNQWRYDNDPPFAPLAPFIDAWNRLGLQPPLRFATATEAVFAMEKAAGGMVPTHKGEWTDWWANGDASGPREVAASRLAKRHLAAAGSPVLGPFTEAQKRKVSEIQRELCLFDEHTWGANVSVSHPWSLDTLGQYTEKSLLAYRPMGHAEWLLGRRARVAATARGEGTWVINTAPLPYTGWVEWRGGVGNQQPEWVLEMPANSMAKLTPVAGSSARPEVVQDGDGWPTAAKWPGMELPLFAGGLGELLAVQIAAPARRSSKMNPANLRRVAAKYGEVKLTETAHTLVYAQPMIHECLSPLGGANVRKVELFRDRPRATVTMTLNRRSSPVAEALFVAFPFPVRDTLPRFSNGGVPYTPHTDQLPGSCRDYYAIDGWAHYTAAEAGHWVWVTRDAPMVTVGGPHTWQRITAAPSEPHRLHAMVYDNFWHTNFVADEAGVFEFRFELAWQPAAPDREALAATLVSEPVLVVNPALTPTREMMERVFQNE
ncbi:MAG: hypothetical protein JNM66_03845 [Bryobacterales bacterium]|nr:hypothetical protein [Bryobacterales bacterium]